MITDLDARQLRKMKTQLAAFQRGELVLGGFLGDMSFLLNSIEDIPLEWKRQVHELVVTLEEVYAVGLDLNEARIDEQGQGFISEATVGIQRCLDEIAIPEPLQDF